MCAPTDLHYDEGATEPHHNINTSMSNFNMVRQTQVAKKEHEHIFGSSTVFIKQGELQCGS